MQRFLKNRKGSISLFVLLSCLFFLYTATSLAVSTRNNKRSIDIQLIRIKQNYEKDVGKEEQIYDEKYAMKK